VKDAEERQYANLAKNIAAPFLSKPGIIGEKVAQSSAERVRKED
jgi:hypothetical protein